MSVYNFDGHKLMYHPARVAEFLADGDCFPLYIEISPAGSCNHRCIFCAYDYIGYPNRKLETDRTLDFIDELADCGVKSMLFAGEGEPLLHPDIASFARRADSRGIDVGLFTNGQLLHEELAEQLLPSLTFVRFSFNGGGRENYADIHAVRAEQYDRVVDNITRAVALRRQHGWKLDIGSQFVVIPENIDRMLTAATTLKACGVDYLAIKPFMQRDAQRYQLTAQFSLGEISERLSQAESLSDETFTVLARRATFEAYGERSYDHCLGASFITVLNSAGMLASCLPYWEREEFSFGSMYEQSFRAIWRSERRRGIREYLQGRLDAHACPPNCRPHAINEFLWELSAPRARHINFI